MKKEKILITGGAGFIGRSIVEKCLEQGHEVTVIDNLFTGKIENLKPFMSSIRFVHGDILDRDLLESLFSETQPEIVFHLAAIHYIPYCNLHPDQTLRTNTEGTFNILDLSATYGTQTAVIASSGAFYPSLDIPLSEDTHPAPVDVYGLSKLITEQIARYHSDTSSLRCVAARLFNTYGPYETNPHLIPVILQSLSESDEVSLGNIHTKRDYIYVEDVAEILYRMAFVNDAAFTILNVGTGNEHSAEDIVKTIGELLDRNIKIQIDATRIRPVDKQHQMADTSNLYNKTKMQAGHSIRDGLYKLLVHEKLI